MYNFKNDYAEGVHPHVLQKIIETNDTQELGYGEDSYSIKAKNILKEQLQQEDTTIFFTSGGTQANLLVISHLLRPHEAVISAKTGHIFANETGAIEATGHRVITVDSTDGKLYPHQLEQVLAEYSLRPHVVKPRLVYISNSTEIGGIYSFSELDALHRFCLEHELLLFMDGARLGHALTSPFNDLTLPQIADRCDVFYIGGTKNGAMLGEVIVFSTPSLAIDFDYALKQKGALLAKGRFLGLQFLGLFESGLYFDLATHANRMALRMAQSFEELGFSFLNPPATNQIFPILPNNLIHELSKNYAFYTWKTIDAEHSAIRLITSWATPEEVVDQFIAAISSKHICP